MNYKAIFKMEMFKFYKESPFFIAFIVTAIINILGALGIVLIGNSDMSIDSWFSMLLYSVLPFSVLATIVLLAIYPIQSFSIDYKNNVMATIVASGVDRVKLYFTKFIAILINSFLMMLLAVLVPILIMGYLKIFDEGIFRILGSLGKSIIDNPVAFIRVIVVLLATYATVVFATIQLKGSYVAILLFFLYSIGISIVKSVSMIMANSNSAFYDVALIIFSLIQLMVFVMLSINTIKNQDL